MVTRAGEGHRRLQKTRWRTVHAVAGEQGIDQQRGRAHAVGLHPQDGRLNPSGKGRTHALALTAGGGHGVHPQRAGAGGLERG